MFSIEKGKGRGNGKLGLGDRLIVGEEDEVVVTAGRNGWKRTDGDGNVAGEDNGEGEETLQLSDLTSEMGTGLTAESLSSSTGSPLGDSEDAMTCSSSESSLSSLTSGEAEVASG